MCAIVVAVESFLLVFSPASSCFLQIKYSSMYYFFLNIHTFHRTALVQPFVPFHWPRPTHFCPQTWKKNYNYSIPKGILQKIINFHFLQIGLDPTISPHRGKTDNWHMRSRPTNISNDSFVCYQPLSEYVGLEHIKRGFHGEPALKKQYKT